MLRKAMEVFQLYTAQRKELGVTEAARLLARPKSTVSRLLAAMEEAGFLDRADSGQYRVSMRMAAVGEMARQASSLQRMARPALEALTAATGETSNLVVLADGEGVNVEAVDSPQPVMHMGSVGQRFPLHASAACKAILAWKPEEEVRRLVRVPLKACTPATVTDIDLLLAELAEVRVRGYAINWAELAEDLVAVGAPVRDHRSDVVAAISISAPISRMKRDALPRVGREVARAAEKLSGDLGSR